MADQPSTRTQGMADGGRWAYGRPPWPWRPDVPGHIGHSRRRPRRHAIIVTYAGFVRVGDEPLDVAALPGRLDGPGVVGPPYEGDGLACRHPVDDGEAGQRRTRAAAPTSAGHSDPLHDCPFPRLDQPAAGLLPVTGQPEVRPAQPPLLPGCRRRSAAEQVQAERRLRPRRHAPAQAPPPDQAPGRQPDHPGRARLPPRRHAAHPNSCPTGSGCVWDGGGNQYEWREEVVTWRGRSGAVWSASGWSRCRSALYSATQEHEVTFHQFQKGTRTGSATSGSTSAPARRSTTATIVKGAEVGGGEYVMLEHVRARRRSPRARPAAWRSTRSSTSTRSTRSTSRSRYYLGPGSDETAKTYALLRDAMAKANRAGDRHARDARQGVPRHDPPRGRPSGAGDDVLRRRDPRPGAGADRLPAGPSWPRRS